MFVATEIQFVQTQNTKSFIILDTKYYIVNCLKWAEQKYLVSSDVVLSGRDEDDVSVEGTFPEDAVAGSSVEVERAAVLQPRVAHASEVGCGKANLKNQIY